MSKKNWSEVIDAINPIIGGATKEQKKLLTFLGINLSSNLPYLVVAAKLRDNLAKILDMPRPKEPNLFQMSRIEFLKIDSDGIIEPKSNSEAEAWGKHLSLIRRMEHLKRLQIESGDIVEVISENYFAEVSSIGEEGRVYFKGGNGAASWPDLLEVRAKRDDQSLEASAFRKQSSNHSRQLAPIRQWSGSKHRELIKYSINSYANKYDIDLFEKVISQANDEKPIQKHIENNPHLITTLLGGRYKYCIPQKFLGAEYRPDFLIGSTDSLGINWILIELETPKSGIYLKLNGQLDQYARKGVAQIQEWREWLLRNIGYATNKISQNGLGLIDIRPKSKAIVIVGRRTYMRETKEIARNQSRDNNDIHIHTYDWLIENLYGAMEFDGSPLNHPYLF